MAESTARKTGEADWQAAAESLAARFGERAAAHDEGDRFVRDNIEALKAAGLSAAGVPAEFGGWGLGPVELGAMLRILGRACGSTALAFSMHTHQVATAAWRWRREGAPMEGLLRRVAAERLILVSSGGSDWLAGSARAERVEGGFRVDGRKIFASGVPAGDLLMTTAVLEEPGAAPTVLHVTIPLGAPGVSVLDTWQTMGMRGTGSHDVELRGVFVPDAAVGVRRPSGVWHPLMHTVSMVAFPLVYSAYLGVAEAAREAALSLAAQRRAAGHLAALAGEMDTHLTGARLAVDHMLRLAAGADPGPETTNAVFQGRTLAARGMLAAVDRAMELAGGAGFYRSRGLERLFRDIQGARYHPLGEKIQAEYAGHLALGLDASRIG